MIKRLFRIPNLLLNGKKLAGVLRSHMAGAGMIRENNAHIEAGAAWLMKAQERGGGGYSRSYCLYNGWDKPYIETTGYIVSTMLSAGRYLNNDGFIDSAKKAAYWLLGVQKENGAFCEPDSGLEQVFDTGQVLAGLIAAFREWTDKRFLDAAVKAGTWLTSVQEEDGSWKQYAYNRIEHTYYVKVAAALLGLARVTGSDMFYDAALKNIRWTISCQTEDGFFRYTHFKEGESPFLHTITYVLEGLMDSYDLVKEKSILDAAMRSVDALREINQTRDLLLCSQYDERWVRANRERCITGLAQWAGIALRAYDHTGNNDLLMQAVKTMYYLKSKQHLKPEPDLYGGLPGSVPLWGKYLGFCYPNWGVKFFIDALLDYEKYSIPLWREQEIWVAEAFKFSDTVVGETLGANDRKYAAVIEREINTDKGLRILDIGCGKGKFIEYFSHKYPHWEITGIDPSFSRNGNIKKGSIYSSPVPDNYADMALVIEVMQHVDNLDRAMTELSRVIVPDGYLVIGDRDPFSIIGALKPLMETAGLWMYPWDSPFREQWRSVKEWKDIFGEQWQITFSQSFGNPDNRIPLSNRFYVIIARKKRA
jgi:SAM-dependent methyltransferase